MISTTHYCVTSKFKVYKSLVTSILLHGCETWTLLADSKTRIQAFKTKCLRKLLRISYLEHKTNDWVWSKTNSLVDHRNLFWQPSRNGNLHVTGKSHATTASPRPSFRAPWTAGDTVVSRRNAGWTASKSGRPCPFKNCSQEPPAEKTGRGSLLTPHVPPKDPIGQGTELV